MAMKRITGKFLLVILVVSFGVYLIYAFGPLFTELESPRIKVIRTEKSAVTFSEDVETRIIEGGTSRSTSIPEVSVEEFASRYVSGTEITGLTPSTIEAKPARSIPFYLGGWDSVLRKNIETIIPFSMQSPDVDIHDCWQQYNPDKIVLEASEFLKSAYQKGEEWSIDPDVFEITLNAIRIERVPIDFHFNSWYVIVELSAWGKDQISGVPLWFQLVMIPGEGFMTPALATNENSRTPMGFP